MKRTPIKPNQIWKSKKGNFQVLIVCRKGDRWQAKKLTDKPDVYNGTHTMTTITIWKSFDLLL